MNWKALSARLCAQHSTRPQDVGRIVLALSQVEEGFRTLGSLGHRMYLAEGLPPEEPGWPKILFHVDAAPNGRIVYGEAEASELGPGWFDTLIAAQLWDGMQTQFAGRGGVPRASLPAVTAPPSLIELALFQKQMAEAKAKAIAEFKARRAADAKQV